MTAGSRDQEGTDDDVVSDGCVHLGPKRGPKDITKRAQCSDEDAKGRRIKPAEIIFMLYVGLLCGWLLLQNLQGCTAVRAGVYQCSRRHGEDDIMNMCSSFKRS